MPVDVNEEMRKARERNRTDQFGMTVKGRAKMLKRPRQIIPGSREWWKKKKAIERNIRKKKGRELRKKTKHRLNPS